MPRWRTTRTRRLHLHRALPSGAPPLLPGLPSSPPADRVVGRHPRRHRTSHMAFALALALRYHLAVLAIAAPRFCALSAPVIPPLSPPSVSLVVTTRVIVLAQSPTPHLARAHLLDVTSAVFAMHPSARAQSFRWSREVLRDGLRCRLPLLRLGWANGLRSCVLRSFTQRTPCGIS
jgi:hypothetical protein